MLSKPWLGIVQGRWSIFVMVAVMSLSDSSAAEELDGRPAKEPSGDTPMLVDVSKGQEWSFAASAYTYIVPDDRDYIQPTIEADRGALHLEVRYNYEDLDTGSAWIGCNFGGGGVVEWELIPMAGVVIGHTFGVAPGYKGSVNWRNLELYSEGEYVVDMEDSRESFFYSWSELTVSLFERFRTGLVTQRTHIYDADADMQIGVLAGWSFEQVDVSAYLLDLEEDTPIVALAVEFEL